MTVAIAHVGPICGARAMPGSSCRVSYQCLWSEAKTFVRGRLCRDCLFVAVINTLPRLPSRRRWSHQVKVHALAFSRVIRSLLRSCSGCPTHRWLTLFALQMDRRTSNSFDKLASSSVVRSRAIAIRFPHFDNNCFSIGGEKQSHCHPISTAPRMCMAVFFPRENAPVAILTVDSKRFVWATWTVMKNCRSQFATRGPLSLGGP